MVMSRNWLKIVPLSLSACGALLAYSGCTQFPSVVSSQREEAQANIGAARMHESRGQDEEALSLYRSALSKDGRSVEAHGHLALLAARNHRWDEAEQHFQAALKLRPGNARLLSDYGYLLFRQDRLLEAERTTRIALEANPDDSRTINNLALIVGRQGRYLESLTLFRQAGNEAQAQNNIAYLYAQRGEIDLAEAAYIRAIELDSRNQQAGIALVQLCDSHPARPAQSASPGAATYGDERPDESPRMTARTESRPAFRRTSDEQPARTELEANRQSPEIKPARNVSVTPAPVPERSCAAPSVVAQPSIRSRQMAEQAGKTPTETPVAPQTLSPAIAAPVAVTPPKPLPTPAPAVSATPTFSAPMQAAAPPVSPAPAAVSPAPAIVRQPATKLEVKAVSVPTPKISAAPATTPAPAPAPTPAAAPTPAPAPVAKTTEPAAAPIEKQEKKPVVQEKKIVEAPTVELPSNTKAEEPKPIEEKAQPKYDISVELPALPAAEPVIRRLEVQPAAPMPVTPAPAPVPNLLRMGPNAAPKPQRAKPVAPVIQPPVQTAIPDAAPALIQSPTVPLQSPTLRQEPPASRSLPEALPEEPESEYPTLRVKDKEQSRNVAPPKLNVPKVEKPAPVSEKPESTELTEDDILLLAELLRHGKPAEREAAATALGEFGPQAAPAVPALIEALVDKNRGIRQAAGVALEKISASTGDDEPGATVPASAKELQPIPQSKSRAKAPAVKP